MVYFKKLGAFIGVFLIPSMALASSEWDWTSTPTPGSTNTFTESEEDEAEDSYEDGNLSSNILLSELMPNPEGTDTDSEWIELYNAGTENIDLGNWTLDDEEGGSDPYTFPAGTVIEAQDFLIIERSESDISLNNDTDEVRLFDYEGTLQDRVEYTSAPEGDSYARIGLEEYEPSHASAWLGGKITQKPGSTTIHNKSAHSTQIVYKKAQALLSIPIARAESWESGNWEWTSDVTEGYRNPVYHFIQGEIEAYIPLEKAITLNDNGNQLYLSLSKMDLNEELVESVFQPGNWISGFATLIEADRFELKRLEDTETLTVNSPTSTNALRKNILMASLMISGLAAYALMRKMDASDIKKPG